MMKRTLRQSWLLPLSSGAIAFGITLAFREFAPFRDLRVRIGKSFELAPSGNNFTVTERARKYREYVMNILQTRRSQPQRSPAEWMHFLASLDAWYRSARVDCVTTLTSGSFGAILHLVEEPYEDTPNTDLLAIAKETSDSNMQISCWKEIWRRATLKGPQACEELYRGIPAIYQPLFRDKLVKLWVDTKGLQSLDEIMAVTSMPAEAFASAFELCAKTDPEGVVKYLENGGFRKTQDRYGASLADRGDLRFQAWRKLPAERALEFLSKEPPSIVRDSLVGTIVWQAVDKNPQIAAQMIAQDPHVVLAVCVAAESVAERDPRSAAAIFNMVVGERLRTSMAKRTALDLPPAKANEFVESLSDPLTRETVRAAVERLRKGKPTETARPTANPIPK